MIPKWKKVVPWTSKNHSCHRTSQRPKAKMSTKSNLKTPKRTKKSWLFKICKLPLPYNSNKLIQSSLSICLRPVTNNKTTISRSATFTTENTCKNVLVLIITFPGPSRLSTISIKRFCNRSIGQATTMKESLPQNGTFKTLWSSKERLSFRSSNKKSRKMLMRNSEIICLTLSPALV